MVNYTQLDVGDPLAFVFEKLNLKWMSGIIAVSALVAMASVLLVFQMGQPRIWMSMSRDGLLPKQFSKIHPKFKTPSFATIVTGFVVAIPALFMNLSMVTDLCSIGTLFAFVLVCAGVLTLQNNPNIPRGKFKTPYINSKYIMLALFVGAVIISFTYNKQNTLAFIFNDEKMNEATEISFIHKIPMWIFIITSFLLTVWAFRKNLSLIPMLGLISCLYMMAELGIANWIGFGIWLLIGLFIYFGYSRKRSKLNK
jgi:amino acid transporter